MFEQIKDREGEYINSTFAANSAQCIEDWAHWSGMTLATREFETIRYGQRARNEVDLFRTQGTAEGTLFFIHGGYWVQGHKDDFAFVVQGALARGWNVAMVGYTLAPEVDVLAITQEVRDAIECVAAQEPGLIRITGHSAGGHLAAMMAVEGWLSDPVASRVEHVVSISGVHDIRALPDSKTAQVDPQRNHQMSCSPALLLPRPGTFLTCWVGMAERAEFIRQSRMLADAWLGLGASTQLLVARERNHFDIINDLVEPNSALVQCLLQPMPAPTR